MFIYRCHHVNDLDSCFAMSFGVGIYINNLHDSNECNQTVNVLDHRLGK